MTVQQFLTHHHITFQEFSHPPLFTVEQAKEREEKIPGMHTKNIFVKIKKGPCVMITIRADKKLDTKMFKLQTGIKDFSFATSNELMNEIHITPGSVGIFGLINNPQIILYIDQDIRDASQAGWHPNINTSTIVLTKQGLVEYLCACNITHKVIIL
ncbi:MAG TPA: YbaK/EbsC family protein [Candidatus Absconditabacterales bacterium]|nr:YbaK/EbsC family protein [Candidatus Absconditabacterales bacterium]HNG97264.1 YbaK/EbsC family protein [Candidatus Absconditabacterales bacterium]